MDERCYRWQRSIGLCVVESAAGTAQEGKEARELSTGCAKKGGNAFGATLWQPLS